MHTYILCQGHGYTVVVCEPALRVLIGYCLCSVLTSDGEATPVPRALSCSERRSGSRAAAKTMTIITIGRSLQNFLYKSCPQCAPDFCPQKKLRKNIRNPPARPHAT
ncbi:unnamed protein product, partial [Ectocarpus sp. 6 AP-2014]